MTLEAWVYPDRARWLARRRLQGPDDNYYLERSTSWLGRAPRQGVPSAATLVRTVRAAPQHLVASGRDVRRHDGSPVRERDAGRESRPQTGRSSTHAAALTIGSDPPTASTSPVGSTRSACTTRALTQAQIQADMATPIGGGPPPDTEPPTAPTNLAATPVSQTQINLAWTASTDTVGGHRIQGRALPGRELHELRRDRDAPGHDVQQHRSHSRDDVSLPSPGHRRRREPERVLEHRDGGDPGRCPTRRRRRPSRRLPTERSGGSATRSRSRARQRTPRTERCDLRPFLDARAAALPVRETCHSHTVQNFNGVASGSFVAPDHEYPSLPRAHPHGDRFGRPHGHGDRAPRSEDGGPDVPELTHRPPAHGR